MRHWDARCAGENISDGADLDAMRMIDDVLIQGRQPAHLHPLCMQMVFGKSHRLKTQLFGHLRELNDFVQHPLKVVRAMRDRPKTASFINGCRKRRRHEIDKLHRFLILTDLEGRHLVKFSHLGDMMLLPYILIVPRLCAESTRIFKIVRSCHIQLVLNLGRAQVVRSTFEVNRKTYLHQAPAG